MTGRAKNVVTVAPPIHNFPRHRKWKGCRKPAIRAAQVKMFVLVEKASRHDPNRQGTGGPVIREERTLLERIVPRLIGHLLPACGEQEQAEQE